MVGTPEEEGKPGVPPFQVRPQRFIHSTFSIDRKQSGSGLTLMWETEAGGWPVLGQQGPHREALVQKDYKQK